MQALTSLRKLESKIEKMDRAAPYIWIETYNPGGRGDRYARLKADKALWGNGKRKSKGIGRVGGPEHKEWEEKIKNRNDLNEVRRVIKSLAELSQSFVWEMIEKP